LLPPAAAEDVVLVAELCDLVNRVYSVAEEGLWLEGHERISAPEMIESIRGGQLAVARFAGRIVGSVRIRQLDRQTGEFGLLVADPGYRGIGIGRNLVHFSETLARSRGLTVMQLELLAPREWKHPIKEFLNAWYTRLGYRIVGQGDFAAAAPQAAPSLATPCDFHLYQKRLGRD
jgi:GNAT superfamily N-acetyltransferase